MLPNLIDYINISELLENDMSRCNCTSGGSRGWVWAVVCVGGGWGHRFCSLKHFYYLSDLVN